MTFHLKRKGLELTLIRFNTDELVDQHDKWNWPISHGCQAQI